MKYFDAFSGIGGFHQAFSYHGHECVGHCEIDPHASKFYNDFYQNHGVYYDDFRTINTAEMPDFNCLVAGFPCQSWSIASASRKGFGDDRGNLFYEILRVIEAKRPQSVLLENVKGLLNHRTEGEHSFSQMLLSISQLGYDCEFAVINSKYYLPQNRERVFIYASRRSGGKPRTPIFPITERSEEGSSGEERRVGEDVSFAIDASYWKGANNTISRGKRQLIQVNNPRHSNDRVYDPEGISPTLRDMSAGGNRQPYIALKEVRTEEAKRIRREIKKATGKDHSPRRKKEIVPRNDYLSGTLTTSPTFETTISNGTSVRRLTPLECWRLQGFSDKAHQHCVDLGVSATNRYRMAGNSVSVPVVTDIVGRITKQMEG